MEILSVVVAAIASYVFGAIWYMVLAGPWMEAAGIEKGEDGRPKQGMNMGTYALAFLATLLVAGMMRHIFSLSGIDTSFKSVLGGLGLGVFIASPWIMINNAFGGKPFKLTLINGGYASFGCAIIGGVLSLF